MAIEQQSNDLWSSVQRDVARYASDARRRSYPANTLPFPPSRTIELSTDPAPWHDPLNEARAIEICAQLETALLAGKRRRVARLRASWLRVFHADRIARARGWAAANGLRLDPMGRGPTVDRPTLHFRDRLPWGLEPLHPYDTSGLPDRARSVVEEWTTLGAAFDSFITADEPPGTASFPTHCLIGAISVDGRTADWFVLDRWAS